MTPPTIHEFAGIFMLALLTAGLIAHPSTRTHAAPAPITLSANDNLIASSIDGIETIALPAPRDADSAKKTVRDSAAR